MLGFFVFKSITLLKYQNVQIKYYFAITRLFYAGCNGESVVFKAIIGSINDFNCTADTWQNLADFTHD